MDVSYICSYLRFTIITPTPQIYPQERAQGKSFPLCPHCFSYPPFEGQPVHVYTCADVYIRETRR